MISIIVLNHNDRKFLEDCLRSVLRSDFPDLEIIFVDNASTDDSVELVQKLYGYDSRLKIIKSSENLGCAGGFNLGLRFCQGEYVAFLASDVEVEPSWLKEAVKVMDSDHRIGAVQPKYLMADRSTIDTAGGFIDRFGFSHNRGYGEVDNGEYDNIDEIFYGTSSALVTRKSVLRNVDSFDPTTFFLGEDVDLCWRIWLSEHKVLFVPSSKVYHMGSVKPSGQALWEALYYSCKNHMAMLLKNYELHNLAKYLPIYVFLVFGAVLNFALHGKYEKMLACTRALIWNIKNFRYVWIKNLEINHLIRKIPDRKIPKKLFCRPLFTRQNYRTEKLSS